ADVLLKQNTAYEILPVVESVEERSPQHKWKHGSFRERHELHFRSVLIRPKKQLFLLRLVQGVDVPYDQGARRMWRYRLDTRVPVHERSAQIGKQASKG